MKKTSDNEKSSKKMTSKQLAALIGVALLVILYVGTLIVAIVDTSSSGSWFRMCLFATVAIPLLIWIYTWMYGKLTGRHTIADLDMSTTAVSDAADGSDTNTSPDAVAGSDTNASPDAAAGSDTNASSGTAPDDADSL